MARATLENEATASATGVKKRGGRTIKTRSGIATSSDDRWTIRGVSKHIQQVANKSAKSRGMTTGDWLSEAVAKHSRADNDEQKADETDQKADGGSKVPTTITADAVMEMMMGINERIARLEENKKKGIFGRLLGRQNKSKHND